MNTIQHIKQHKIKCLAVSALFLFSVLSFAYGADGNKTEDREKPNDENITSFVQMELIVQDGVNWNNVDVSTIDGVVTLTGQVDNLLAKDRSVKIAKAIKGVRAVVDQIEVKKTDDTDFDLKTKVERALLLDPATDSYEVDIEAEDGKITLTGKVDSWQEKQLAELVAKGVRGVTDVENEIFFDYDTNRRDMEIRQDIIHTMEYDIRVDEEFVNVEVQDGEVTLSGTVGSMSEQSQAIIDSWVAGVKDVNSEDLLISDWADDEELRDKKYVQKSDEQIKEAIEDAFLYDPRVYSFNPSVSVSGGIVTLSGTVDNLKAKRAAEVDAKNVVGVWKVNNLLKVRSDENFVSDLSINRNVHDALALNPYVDGYDIGVLVDDGKVTLTGYVENYLEKYEAEDAAATIYGVEEVKNKLNVEVDAVPYAYDYNDQFYYPYSRDPRFNYSTTKTDWEIEQDVENQIWWSPFVNLSDVAVEIDNGIAILEGTVDSWNEYYHAEKNAFEGGALGVDNDLEIEEEE
jgi:osmotically-inducible protein OsmY